VGRKNRKINRALRVTKAEVASLRSAVNRAQAATHNALALAERAVNETKAINEALAALNKEQEVQRIGHALLDELVQKHSNGVAFLHGEVAKMWTRAETQTVDIAELRADIVRLSEIVGSDNADLQTLGAKVRSLRTVGTGPDGATVPGTIINGDFVPDRTDDQQWPIVVMTEEDEFITVPDAYALADGTLHMAGTDYKPVEREDATVTDIFHGGVDIPIPTYTTPSEVCAPAPTHRDPIQVSIGALNPNNFEWKEGRAAFEAVLDRAPWPRDEGAFEYETTANGYRITLIHKDGEPLTDMDIHDTLWKIVGVWKKEN
jgi:hypothetical protein